MVLELEHALEHELLGRGVEGEEGEDARRAAPAPAAAAPHLSNRTSILTTSMCFCIFHFLTISICVVRCLSLGVLHRPLVMCDLRAVH